VILSAGGYWVVMMTVDAYGAGVDMGECCMYAGLSIWCFLVDYSLFSGVNMEVIC